MIRTYGPDALIVIGAMLLFVGVALVTGWAGLMALAGLILIALGWALDLRP